MKNHDEKDEKIKYANNMYNEEQYETLKLDRSMKKIDQNTSPITFSPKRSLKDLNLKIEKSELPSKSDSPRDNVESPPARFDLGLS